MLDAFFDVVLASSACQIEWTDIERFEETRRFFLKHADHAWSFTDFVSFRVMKESRIREALTKDAHFEEAGFIPLLK